MILLYINNNFDNQENEELNDNQNQELEINRQNRENYEKLMKESSTNLDGYWDKNNVFVKIFLLILALAIIAGVVYYVMMYLNSR